ncbi:helix-turn-helix domain-containing protein [Streptomyces sp. NBC_01221]|uniref:helix-turn-helix domain-containing protein n=1 Tax=Streptomyces sp. NBC_01221 TaxID=2903782 RepID=UPI00224E5CD2|nr:helix-turn-helix transcriptional regulator [Streptomyces sp. NBC_01221]MCX4792624.1 helix-turn-helix domain-containing protein [Streptomyces sp. NBC_01221]
MGRPEKEIATTNAALRHLAEWLRDQRARAGLSYRELANRAGLHATTLQRVASGSSVPQLMPVLAYARGCDAQPEEARRLWQRARREHVRTQHGRQPAPAPAFVRDFADLSAALRGLYERACAPSLRIMERRAGGFGALPRSSAHRIVNKQTVPHSLQQFQAFLRACEVPVEQWKEWEDAWTRAWRFEKQEGAGLNEVWSDPRPQDQAIRARKYADEDVRAPVGDGGRVSVMARGPEYYRPLAPRRRSGPRKATLQEVFFPDVPQQREGRPPSKRQLAHAVGQLEHTAAKLREMGWEPLFSLPSDHIKAELVDSDALF